MTSGETLARKEDAWPVAAALEIVDETGFGDVSVRSVAARAGYTPMAVYRHVSNLDELLRRVVRRVFEDWESRVYGVLEEGTPNGRLWRYAKLYRHYALRHPQRYELLFVLRHGIGTHRLPEEPPEDRATTFHILVETVQDAMDSGILTPDDPVETALLMWSTAHGLVTLRRSGRFQEPEAFARFYDRSMLRLLRAFGAPFLAEEGVAEWAEWNGSEPSARAEEADP